MPMHGAAPGDHCRSLNLKPGPRQGLKSRAEGAGRKRSRGLTGA